MAKLVGKRREKSRGRRRGRLERREPDARHPVGLNREGSPSRGASSTRVGGLRLALVVLVALRIGLGVVAFIAVSFGPRAGSIVGQWEELVLRGTDLWSKLLSPWQRWDALWYQHIAENGYAAGDGSTAFFPLYPLLSRIVSVPLLGNVVLAELLVSSAAFAAAMWLLYRLARLDSASVDTGSVAADRTAGSRVALPVPQLAVLLTALFPVGFFLLAPYTEGLFLALTLASFWFARTNRPWAAGAAGFFASLTRAHGIFLALPLAFEYLRQRDVFPWILGRGGRRPGLGVLASGLPALGLLATMAYQRAIVGVRGSALETYAQWGYQVVAPWRAIAASWNDIRAGGPHGNVPEIEALNLACLLAFSALAVVAARRLPVAYALFALPYAALLLTHEGWLSPLMSTSRFVLPLFPCFIVVAVWLARRPRLAVGWLGASALLQLLLFQFWVRWGFVA